MCVARNGIAFWELRFTRYTDIAIFRHRLFLQTPLNVSSVALCSTRELAQLIHMGSSVTSVPANAR